MSFNENSIARGTFVEQNATKVSNSVSDIPRKVLLYGSPNDNMTATVENPKRMLTVNDATIFGFGSELSSMVSTAFAYNPNIEIWAMPLVSTDISKSKSAANITFTGTSSKSGTLYFYINAIRVSVGVAIADNASVIATKLVNTIQSNINLPCTAMVDASDDTMVLLTSKYSGITSNNITIDYNYYDSDEREIPTGITIVNTKFIGGLGSIDIEPTFTKWGNNWFTIVALPYSDVDMLKKMDEFAEKMISPVEIKSFQYVIGFNGSQSDYLNFTTPLNYKHLVVMNVENSISSISTIASSSAVGMENMHAELSSASYYGILKDVMAGKNVGLTTYTEKDAIVKSGGCTTTINDDNTVSFENTVTTYKKNEASAPSDDWRYPQVLASYQTVSYQTKLRFTTAPFNRAVLVDENTVTGQRLAVKPSRAKSALIGLIRQWGFSGIIRNVDVSIEKADALIAENNATRIKLATLLYFALPLEQKHALFDWTIEV